MNDANQALIETYRNNFLREVEHNVEEGEWTKMCIQCGVCSGSCPFGDHWEHPPQELFMMIRAGKRDAVLGSSAMWMCTSCYNCIVRCPREIPITHIMHGLASYAERLGLAPKEQPTRRFGRMFWANLETNGRVNETVLGLQLYFMDGFAAGVKRCLEMAPIGWNMLRTKRFNPFAIMPFLHKRCTARGDIRAILEKARAIEAARHARFDG